MDNDLISRAEAKKMLRNRLGWLMLFDLDLALDVLDKVPTAVIEKDNSENLDVICDNCGETAEICEQEKHGEHCVFCGAQISEEAKE